jgi:hypothetical protein
MVSGGSLLSEKVKAAHVESDDAVDGGFLEVPAGGASEGSADYRELTVSVLGSGLHKSCMIGPGACG